MVTKGHTHLQSKGTVSCRFVLVCMTSVTTSFSRVQKFLSFDIMSLQCKWMHELLNDSRVRILINFKKIDKINVIKCECPAKHLKSKFWEGKIR